MPERRLRQTPEGCEVASPDRSADLMIRKFAFAAAAAPVVYYDPCYITKWVKTPFGFQKKVIFVCY
jgi:hypothetical protein